MNLSGNTLPIAGAFSLSGYNSLDPVKSVVSSYDDDLEAVWERIGTENIIIDTESSSAEYDGDAYHFIVCNGLVGEDGQIIVTENWEKQIPALTGRWQDLSSKVIRVGIIIDGINVTPSEVQVKRANLLAGTLARKFDIPSVLIFTPFF